MNKTSDQLDKFWDAIVAGETEKASEIRKGLDRESESNSASEIANLLLQLHDARHESENSHSSIEILDPGTQVGDYQILNVIGRGGMGVVYRAVQTSLKRVVALKTIRTDRMSPRSIRRFRVEAATIARLKHPHIVAVHDVGEFNGTWFYSMDWIEGESLNAKIKSNSLSPEAAADILLKVADAVAFAHENRVLHRDIKPSNILICSKGQVFVSDFGLARSFDVGESIADGFSRLTQTGSILGTPSYLSPEQAAGHSEDESPATDVYGLGATLYESLCGRPPFLSRSLVETLRQIGSVEAVQPSKLNPEVSVDLNTICMKCLEKEPHRRYRDAAALRDDLQRFLSHQPILARPANWLVKMNRWRRREPRLAASMFGILCLFIILLFTSFGYSLSLNQAFKKTELAKAEAIKASQIARSQRDQTLNTLNQIVYRIHTELQKDPGNLTVRRQLLQTAVEGFEKIVAEYGSDSNDVPQRAAAIARIKLADVLVLLGEEDRARLFYREAIEIADAILEFDPGLEHQFDLATAWYRLGLVEISLDRLKSAQVNLQNSERVLLELNLTTPGPALTLYQNVLFSQGWVSEQSFQPVQAIGFYHRLRDQLDAAPSSAGKTVEDRRLLCNVNARLANCHTEQFQLKEAKEYFEAFIRDYKELDWGATEGQESIHNPAWAMRDIGKYLLRTQQIDEAIKFSERSIEKAERLMSLHRDNVQVAIDLGIARFHHAMILRAMGELELADRELQNAIESIESVPGAGRSDRGRMTLPFPYVYRMEFSQRKLDYESALKYCVQATRVMDSLQKEGKLGATVLQSALVQTRRLEHAFKLIPEAIADTESIGEQPVPLAALLYVFCCDYFAHHGDYAALSECGKELLNLEVDDPIQFAIHMNSLARALCRAAIDLNGQAAERSKLIDQAFESLRRSIDLNPDVFNSQMDTEPDLAILRAENEFSGLIDYYRSKVANPGSIGN